jgi:phospholipid/cholesterol/gamma-HCH transport system permease protein
MVQLLDFIGSKIISLLQGLGDAVLFLWRSCIAFFVPPYRFFNIIRQLETIGARSMLVVSLIGLFTGAVLAVQMEYSLSKFGASGFTGSAIALSLIRELGPVLTALMVIGRSGSATTAEIGIMKITEQIDAIRSMGLDPIEYLMTPRIIAGTIAMPLLTSLFVVVGIIGGNIVAAGLLGISSGTFMSEIVLAVSPIDIYSMIVKSFAFGFIFAWISCYRGYNSGFGAVGVNRATTQSVVTSSVIILVVDYFLTSILTRFFLNQ